MLAYAEETSRAAGFELPLPPAVTQWHAALAANDDVVLMPPFSRATMHPPLPLPVTIEPIQPPVAPDPEQDLADELADRLEGLAAQLRRLGFKALLKPRSEQEPIDVVLASVIAGFIARR